MKAGRPTDLDEDVIHGVWDYLERHQELGDLVPSIEGLAHHIGCAISTVYAWEKLETENGSQFSEAVSAVRVKQGRDLINGGLAGDLNAPITKLILTKHGYSDKVETDHRSSDGSMTPKVIERRVVDPKADDSTDATD